MITTANGKGAVSERDPLSLGASIRLRSAQRLLAECDAVWRSEPSSPSRTSGATRRSYSTADLVRIDIDPAQRHKNAVPTVAISADAAACLEALAAAVGDGDGRDRGAAATEAVRTTLRDEALADVTAALAGWCPRSATGSPTRRSSPATRPWRATTERST